MESKIVSEFVYRGHPCMVKRIGLATENHWYCGYVQSGYTNVQCHGGITFQGSEGGVPWIGFDCMHYGDNPTDHGQAFCEAECKKIVDQLIQKGY